MQEKQDQQDLRELSESREFDPRVSEYLKEKLCFWRKDFGVVSTDGEERLDEQVSSGPAETPDRQGQWRQIFFAGFVFVLIAQIIFEFKLGNPPWLGILFVLSGLVTLFFVFYSNDIALPGCAAAGSKKATPFNYLALAGAVLISVFSFFLWRNSGFGLMQVLVWLVNIALLGYASFSGGEGKQADAEGEPLLSHQIKRESWRELFSDKRYLTVCVLVIVLVLLFQILFIRKTPVELVSQQVETFLAVEEIAGGSRALLFPRNVVSEPLGYYWLALISRLFPASMRICAFHVANILSFCIGLAFLFHLAKLLFDKWVAIVAVFLFGVGFWPILQNTALLGSSLVFPLLSAVLYYLFRGLLREKRGDIFLFGVISGLGLFANKLFLMMPILALLMIFIWWIFTRKQNRFLRVLAWFGLAVLTMAVVAGPFMATVSQNPTVYLEPIFSRISDLEVNIEGHAFVIFIKNLLQAMGLVNWSNRSGWVDGIANRPALDL
ncbi:MAG TPA: glycosyltransferase family 39 protein, partial [Anaerolineaceae bacterium]|nr:glycosyltransferase family 39 protein [Anaerolineaceae bacterium]